MAFKIPFVLIFDAGIITPITRRKHIEKDHLGADTIQDTIVLSGPDRNNH